MRILVDEKDLKLLLEEKKNFIGKEVAIDSIISAFSFLLSSVFAEYKSYFGISGKVFKSICVIAGLIFSGIVIMKIIKNQKNRYTHKDLLKDINSLNKITHEHSIAVIKDTFNEFSNRYLVYKDTAWDCYLFPNYKTNDNNENYIKEHLSNELKLNINDIQLKYKCKNISHKLSQRDKRHKYYDHKFYLTEIYNFNNTMKKDEFEIDGKKYFWKTIYELELDKNVQEKNLDILNQVKYNF